MTVAVEPSRPLDPALLREAVRLLIHRHDALRVKLDQRALEQVIAPTGSEAQCVVVADDEKLVQAAHRAFDLQGEELFQVLFVDQPNQRQIVCIRTHHLVSDAWSLDITMRELTRCYESVESGTRLPEREAMTFADFVREELDGPDPSAVDAACRYWSTEFEGFSGTSLPLTTVPMPRVLVHKISAERLARVRGMCREYRATPYTLTVALLSQALRDTVGFTDVVLRCPTANRLEARRRDSIGFFGSLALLRIKSPARSSTASVVDTSRRAVLGGLAHSRVPMHHVLPRLDPSVRRALGDSMVPQIWVREVGRAVQSTATSTDSLVWHPPATSHSSPRSPTRSYGIDYDLFLDLRRDHRSWDWALSFRKLPDELAVEILRRMGDLVA